MRGEVYVTADPYSMPRGWIVTCDVVDAAGQELIVVAWHRLSVVADALQRELRYGNTTEGAIRRWVERRMVVGAEPRLVLDVVEVARLLDRHGVPVPDSARWSTT